MIYCFDLDGTLCSQENDYNECIPFLDRIQEVNRLYDEGHTIIIDTARGSKTGINWNKLTKKQLDEWQIPYHKLRIGKKFFADIYVDDKALSDKEFFK